MTVPGDRMVERERGLQRQLTRRHMTMIAMGGAIGTGLFLGSGMAVGQAGPRALRSMVFRLGLFYIVAIALVVAIVPWQRAGLVESPFVTVFRSIGVPFAAGLMNFVVLTAALSSMN